MNNRIVFAFEIAFEILVKIYDLISHGVEPLIIQILNVTIYYFSK